MAGLARLLTCGGLLAGVGLWVLAAALPWADEIVAREIRTGGLGSQWATRLPFADAPLRAAARQARTSSDATRLHEEALRRRPLYAPGWLELSLENESPDDAARLADRAARLWPARPRLQWRVASVAYVQQRTDAAHTALRQYLRVRPHDVGLASQLARRAGADPRSVVMRVIPETTPRGKTRDDYLLALLDGAQRRSDLALARECWGELTRAGRAAAAHGYVGLLIEAGLAAAARQAWSEAGGGAGLSNGGFEEPTSAAGFGWRLANEDGVRSSRDERIRREGRFSLHVALESETPVTVLTHLVPVEQGREYRLRGFWRGRGLAGARRPYLDVRVWSTVGVLAEAAAPQMKDWEWRSFELPFRVPQEAQIVEIALRWKSGRTAQRWLSGELWIDDVSLEETAVRDG